MAEEDLEVKNAELTAEIATVNAKNTKLEKLIEKSDKKVKKLEDTIESMKNDLDELKGLVKKRDATIKEKNSELDAINNELAGVKAEAEAAIDAHLAEIKNLHELISALETEVLELKDREPEIVEKIIEKEVIVEKKPEKKELVKFPPRMFKNEYGIHVLKNACADCGHYDIKTNICDQWDEITRPWDTCWKRTPRIGEL